MKQAAGNAHITIITIVSIGLVALVGGTLIPRLMNSTNDKSCCQELGGYISGTMCISGDADGQEIKGMAEKLCK